MITEDNTMEVDVKPNQDDITRSNTETVQDSTNATNVTRSNNLDVNNSDTRSNIVVSESATGSKNSEVELVTGCDMMTENDTTRSNNGIMVENPYETEGDEDENLRI